MTAYYNEIDPYAAQWLRNLIDAGHIAPGIVDERSIEDVYPSDLRGFTQCHFFAGIGVWSYALRSAGWSDDRPVWTGSCPCQPFSAAGKGVGFDDERHLWPHFSHLIKECKPSAVIGEQVASKDVDPWIDLVHADLEAMGYAFGAIPFPAAGVGAPNIRDRLYWVAHAHDARLEGRRSVRERAHQRATGAHRMAGRLANANGSTGGQGCENVRGRPDGGDAQPWAGSGGGELLGGMADAERERVRACGPGSIDGAPGALQGIDGERQRVRPDAGAGDDGMGAGPGAVNGFWRAADWLACRDGKWRPVEPGTFPLAHGASARVGRLRAYGNAINAQAARVWIESVMEIA